MRKLVLCLMILMAFCFIGCRRGAVVMAPPPPPIGVEVELGVGAVGPAEGPEVFYDPVVIEGVPMFFYGGAFFTFEGGFYRFHHRCGPGERGFYDNHWRNGYRGHHERFNREHRGHERIDRGHERRGPEPRHDRRPEPPRREYHPAPPVHHNPPPVHHNPPPRSNPPRRNKW